MGSSTVLAASWMQCSVNVRGPMIFSAVLTVQRRVCDTAVSKPNNNAAPHNADNSPCVGRRKDEWWAMGFPQRNAAGLLLAMELGWGNRARFSTN